MAVLNTRPGRVVPSKHARRQDAHSVLVYLNRLSPGSRRTMGQALRAVVAVYTGRSANAKEGAAPTTQHHS